MDPASDDDVTFELERFGWASEDRLEVAGVWHGVRRRLARPTLVVVVDGRRRRLRTLPGAWGSSPTGWEASFAWQGGPVELDGAELEVGRSIVVELPRPRRARPPEPDQAPEQAPEAAAVIEVAEIEPAQEIEVTPERDASAEREDTAALRAELDAARAEAQEAREQAESARAALEREQEELAIARRSLSTAREAEEEERSDAQSLRSELEDLRGRQERLEEELTGARSEIAASQERVAAADERVAAADERVAAAVTAGREEAQQLHEQLAHARTEAERSQRQEEAEPPARRRFDPESAERSRAQGFEAEPTEPTEPAEPAEDDARSQRFNRAMSEDRPSPRRSGRERSEDRSTALLGARAGSLTGRAAAWASGAAERTRDVFSSDTSADGAASDVTRAPPRAQPQRIRARSVQRAAELDSPSEPSWPLRVMAIGLVAVLLVALALIVSFFT